MIRTTLRCFSFCLLMALGSACSASSGGGSNAAAGDGGEAGSSTGGTSGAGGSAATPSAAGQGGGFVSNMVPPRDSCATAAYQSELLPANLLFVVDRSGSMNCNLPPTTLSADCEQNPVAVNATEPTKWSAIVTAMSAAIDGLARVQNASAGLTFFSNDDLCGAQSTPNVGLGALLPPQVDALKHALQNGSPRGGTPIIGATILGFEHLHEEAMAPGNRFVVLVTDGADSCVGRYPVTGDVVTQFLETEIPKALSVNIRTFVIGAPGSEPARGLLSKVAFAGGTARDAACDHLSDDPAPGAECHFDMTRSSDFAADLSMALERITGRAVLTCEFAVPAPESGVEIDPGKVNVDYIRMGDAANPMNTVELFRDDTALCDQGAEGWQYTEDNAKIRLCGAVCDEVRADPLAQVIVSVGCEQRVIM